MKNLSTENIPILPEIDIDDDGDLRIEWYIERGTVLDIYIGTSGAGYAGLENNKPFHGKIVLPDDVREWLIRNCTQVA